jgi:class 3 adenylate cyclase
MICAKCKAENPEGLKFCNECGAVFKTSCAACGFDNAPTAKFCGNCGGKLSELALAASTSPRAPERTGASAISFPEMAEAVPLDGERKTVTALFADIKGSTELMEDLDPEKARAIFDPALRLMIDAVNRYDGYVVQSTGDGIFALFGAPVAHEDHPQRALYAALRLQEELERYSARLREGGNLPIEGRVGVNTGDVMTEGEQIYGDGVNVAARLESLAEPGGICISGTVHEQVRDKLAHSYADLGEQVVKNIARPVRAWRILLDGASSQLRSSARPAPSAFVMYSSAVSVSRPQKHIDYCGVKFRLM